MQSLLPLAFWADDAPCARSHSGWVTARCLGGRPGPSSSAQHMLLGAQHQTVGDTMVCD